MRTVHHFIVVVILCTYCNARCITTVTTSDNVRSKWDAACSSSCSLYFEPGVHTTTSRLGCQFDGVSMDDPIEIYGDGINEVKLIRPDANQNLIDIDGQYFRIHDMEFEGGSKGIRLEDNTSHAEFFNLKIHDTADGGFTANTPNMEFSFIKVSNVEVYNTAGYGECFYLGCNNDACSFHDNIIEYSYCHDTYSTYGNGQGDGIDMKSGSYNNIIRNNVIINTFGPGIVTYDSYDRGNNIISNNIILNAGNEAIQIVAGTELYNNILHSSCCHALVANGNQLKSGTKPRNVKIIGNTIVSQNPSSLTQQCFEARYWSTNANTFEVKNNLILCGDDSTYSTTETAIYFDTSISAINFENNAFYGYNDNINSYTASNVKLTSISNNIVDWANSNYYPKLGNDLIGAGIYSSNSIKDIDCILRTDPPTIGAYEYKSGKTEPVFYVNPNNLAGFTIIDACAATTATPTGSPITSAPTTATPTSSPTYTTVDSAWVDTYQDWILSLDANVISDAVTYSTSLSRFYHGPYRGLNTAGIEIYKLERSFYCLAESTVSVTFFMGFCGTQDADYVELYLNNNLQTTISIFDGTDYVDADLDSVCNMGWQYKASLMDNVISLVPVNALFDVRFDIGLNDPGAWVAITEIIVNCNPTSVP
eukprot:306719_1